MGGRREDTEEMDNKRVPRKDAMTELGRKNIIMLLHLKGDGGMGKKIQEATPISKDHTPLLKTAGYTY
jgi:hypothetical protein